MVWGGGTRNVCPTIVLWVCLETGSYYIVRRYIDEVPKGNPSLTFITCAYEVRSQSMALVWMRLEET